MNFLSGVRQKPKLLFVYALNRLSTKLDHFQNTNRYGILQFSPFFTPITSIFNNLEKLFKNRLFIRLTLKISFAPIVMVIFVFSTSKYVSIREIVSIH